MFNRFGSWKGNLMTNRLFLGLVLAATVAACSSGGGTSSGPDTTTAINAATAHSGGVVSVSPDLVILHGIPPAAATAGSHYSYTPTVTAASGPVSFSIVGMPVWASFDGGTGTLSGTPNEASVGLTAPITITAHGATGTGSVGPFAIRVHAAADQNPPPNSAPVIKGVPAEWVVSGQSYSFEPGASDAVGRPLVFSIVNRPSWANFSIATGKLTGTPTDHSALDEQDDDFGSGGLTLLPPQSVSSTNLAVAAGKNGIMYLLNADTLRNHAALPTGKALSEVRIGGCWCGQSYYTASDGFGRVVSSGGANVILWKVVGGSTAPLVKLATSTALSTGQSGGFFSTVSSNGTSSGTAVIWGVGRPVNQNPAQVNLYAFNESGNQLLATADGTWPNTGGNANIVPVVANGRVYVASYRSLAIFGLGSGSAAVPPVIAAKPYQVTLPAGIHEIYGTVRGIDGATVLVERRTGAPIKVDAAAAFADFQAAQPSVGHGILIRGSIDEAGVVHAQTLLHAKDASALWPADR